MGAGAYPQVDVGRRDAEFGKEDVGHFFVVVLAGMDEAVVKRGAVWVLVGISSADLLYDWRHFHEVRPGAGDEEQFKFAGHWLKETIGQLTNGPPHPSPLPIRWGEGERRSRDRSSAFCGFLFDPIWTRFQSDNLRIFKPENLFDMGEDLLQGLSWSGRSAWIFGTRFQKDLVLNTLYALN